MKNIWKRVCTGILALTTILTALPITSVQAAETQYWTESSERVGYIEHVMNDGTIHSTFNEGHMRVEGCKLRSNGMPVPLLRNCYSIFNGTKYR